MLRVALADDQSLILGGLEALIGLFGDLEVRIAANDGDQLLDALLGCPVDIVVCDIRMPRCPGIQVVRTLRARGDLTPVLLLTTFDDPVLLHEAVQCGAQGFLLKHADPATLKEAILAIAGGQTLWIPMMQPSLGTEARDEAEGPDQPARLTPREQAVLRLVAGGYSNKEIGRTLGMSDGTARNHLAEIMRKLEARDRTHAVLRALAARLI